jgi:hypothetical protein
MWPPRSAARWTHQRGAWRSRCRLLQRCTLLDALITGSAPFERAAAGAGAQLAAGAPDTLCQRIDYA